MSEPFLVTPSLIHALAHRMAWVDYPDSHWWVDLLALLAFVVAPAWMGWLAIRLGLRWLGPGRRRRLHPVAVPSREPRAGSVPPRPGGARDGSYGWCLERFVVRATLRFQLRLVLLSLLTLPAAWLLLEIPKHIINRAITDADGDGHPEMVVLGFTLSQVELLFALCGSYLAVLTLGGPVSYTHLTLPTLLLV